VPTRFGCGSQTWQLAFDVVGIRVRLEMKPAHSIVARLESIVTLGPPGSMPVYRSRSVSMAQPA
jgi:hypothetical protein